MKLDPWGTGNMLQLMRDYIAVGDEELAISINKRISDLFPGSQASIDAGKLLKP